MFSPNQINECRRKIQPFSRTAWMVMEQIILICDESGTDICKTTKAAISVRAQISYVSAMRYIAALEYAGWIEPMGAGNHNHKWRVKL